MNLHPAFVLTYTYIPHSRTCSTRVRHMSLARLLEDARKQAAQFQHTLAEIEQKSQSNELEKENELLRAEIVQLKTENKAIRTAFEQLKQIREKDKQTIRAWQEKLEPPLKSDEPTQDVPQSTQQPNIASDIPTNQSQPQSHVPSSPPKLSQQALPHSIAVEQENEEDIKVLPETEPPEPLISELDGSINAPFSLGDSQYNTLSPSSLASSQLNKKDWHPEDFILNPQLKQRLEFEDIADKQDTPAGFWDVDFPTSSQIEHQKAAAQQQIKNEGRKRLNEALSGGKYLFKDAKLRRSMRNAR